MKIKIGTLSELNGDGLEILIDEPTRSIVLARFYDGKLIVSNQSGSSEEPTLIVGKPV